MKTVSRYSFTLNFKVTLIKSYKILRTRMGKHNIILAWPDSYWTVDR